MKSDVVSPRHRLIAFYVACGRRTKEIARELKVTPQVISVAKRSPLFHVLVQQIQREMIDHGVKSTVDQVLADGAANVRFLRRLRDGDEALLAECDDKILRLRLGASTALFDRQMPRVRESSGQPVQVVVNVDGIQRSLADASCREVGSPIEMQQIEESKNAGWHLRKLDEVVEEFEREEAV